MTPHLPDLTSVKIFPGLERGGEWIGWLRFDRRRPRERRRIPNLAFGFEITFAAPVAGPIAVGYGVHFGLGQFAPVLDA